MVFPAPAPTVSGQAITVDRLLRQPLEIARDLSDLTLKQYFAEALFNEGAPAPAGAVIYDEISGNLVFPDRDVARKTPGGQFPVIVTSRPEPTTANAEEYGGKFYMTYPAIRRNAMGDMDRNERLLGNAVVRKFNDVAIGILNAAVDAVEAAETGAGEITGADWGTSGTDIFANLMATQAVADTHELGIVLDTVIVNPQQATEALVNKDFRELFTAETREQLVQGADLGTVTPAGMRILKSARQPAGTALVLQRGVIGNRHVEPPGANTGDNIAVDDNGMAVQTWDDPENTRRWVQGWKSEVLYVNFPYAVKRLVGI